MALQNKSIAGPVVKAVMPGNRNYFLGHLIMRILVHFRPGNFDQAILYKLSKFELTVLGITLTQCKYTVLRSRPLAPYGVLFEFVKYWDPKGFG